MAPPALTSNPYWSLDEKYGTEYGISPYLLSAQQWFESSWNPGAVSGTGAFGISQFEPATAKEYGVKQGTSVADVQSQIQGQAEYLSSLDKSEGNMTSALEAYNAGPGGVADAASNGAQGYAQEILAAAGSTASTVTSGTLGAAVTPSSSGSSGSGVLNRSMLVRVGIGAVAAIVLLIAFAHLSEQAPSTTTVQLPASDTDTAPSPAPSAPSSPARRPPMAHHTRAPRRAPHGRSGPGTHGDLSRAESGAEKVGEAATVAAA